jgi:hypothetical protein
MACSDDDRGRSRRSGAEDRGWSHMSGTRWPGGRVVPCAVCTWHVETRSAGFLVESQNQGRRFVSGLTSKPLGRFSPVWPQNRWRWFLPVWPQNRWWVSWLSLKTKIVEGFLIWDLKPAALVW